jgi:hypothetical protein
MSSVVRSSRSDVAFIAAAMWPCCEPGHETEIVIADAREQILSKMT